MKGIPQIAFLLAEKVGIIAMVLPKTTEQIPIVIQITILLIRIPCA